MAGQRAVSRTQHLRVAERPAPAILGGPEPISEGMVAKDHLYNWLHVGGFALWIISPMTLHEAMAQMALAYEAVNKP
jgi:hypothetical protein